MDASNSANNNGSNNDSNSNDKRSDDSNDKSKGSDESSKTQIASTSTANNVCRICSNELLHRSLTDTCLHEFCFNCLYRWSRQHNVCPFCRQQFRNIICNIRGENDFDQIPVDIPVGNVAPNNVRTADEALYNNNEVLLQQYSILRNLAVAQLAQLNGQLTGLDPDSYAALDIQQRIANVEQRRDHATEMIDQMFANMVRLNANLIRAPRNALTFSSRTSIGFGNSTHMVANNRHIGRPIGPIQQQVLQSGTLEQITPTISSTPMSSPPPLSPGSPTSPIIITPTTNNSTEISPTDSIESVEVTNVVVNVQNQNQLPIPLNSGQNAENTENDNQAANPNTDSHQNSTKNNNKGNSVAIGTIGTHQREEQLEDNNELLANIILGIVQNVETNVENQNQIRLPLNSSVENNTQTESVNVNQTVDTNVVTNQDSANNINEINGANSAIIETNNTMVANNNLQNVDNIGVVAQNPIPVQNTAAIIVNGNGAQTARNELNTAANDNNNNSHNTIVHSNGNANKDSKQKQQNQQQNGN